MPVDRDVAGDVNPARVASDLSSEQQGHSRHAGHGNAAKIHVFYVFCVGVCVGRGVEVRVGMCVDFRVGRRDK